jgi:hypothetical protein
MSSSFLKKFLETKLGRTAEDVHYYPMTPGPCKEKVGCVSRTIAIFTWSVRSAHSRKRRGGRRSFWIFSSSSASWQSGLHCSAFSNCFSARIVLPIPA